MRGQIHVYYGHNRRLNCKSYYNLFTLLLIPTFEVGIMGLDPQDAFDQIEKAYNGLTKRRIL